MKFYDGKYIVKRETIDGVVLQTYSGETVIADLNINHDVIKGGNKNVKAI